VVGGGNPTGSCRHAIYIAMIMNMSRRLARTGDW